MTPRTSNLRCAASPVGASAEVVGGDGDPVGEGGRVGVSVKDVLVNDPAAELPDVDGGGKVAVSPVADVVGAGGAEVMPVSLLMLGTGVVVDSPEPGTGTEGLGTVVMTVVATVVVAVVVVGVETEVSQPLIVTVTVVAASIDGVSLLFLMMF
jgi:hypothetical protein